MKKKITMVVLAAYVATMLIGCSSGPGNSTETATEATTEATTTTTEATTTTTSATTTVKEVTESDIEITEYISTFKYNDSDTIYTMIIKNNSDEIVGLTFSLLAKDKNDSVIGAAAAYVLTLGPGEETAEIAFFENVRGVHHVTREMKIESPVKNTTVIGDLESQIHKNKKNVVLTVKNKSESETAAVYAYLLFFDKKGKLVDYASENIYAIEPGETYSKQFDTYTSYSTVKVYYSDSRW